MAVKQKKTTKVKKVAKKVGVSVAAFNSKGEKSTTILSEAIFGQKSNAKLLAQAVRVFLSNQRNAQAKVKTRAEVSLTTAKPYKQKGTGHARHGSKSAPIFVGGGVAHGPTGKRNYKKFLTKKTRKNVLVSALSAKVSQGKLLIADLDNVGVKTKEVANIFKKMEVSYPFLVVHAKSNNLYKAARNIKGINLVPADQLTAYQVIAVKSLILTKGALEALETKFAK